ncbi:MULTISPECIES: thioredoxin family protein [Marinomonas]|uniref:Thioredoxin family protein n=1 Tax=Marinomonas rhodophyticola TaxID=2992803 RepID=A0ABT3KG43_9GAMM|nr:thioredoxin family protein [Marinomonas sp. KJ51-3]MCW4629516.1 thioredoxin family protein [Marinomonas sp. KJ51-3]
MQAMTIGFNSEYAEEAPSLEEINALRGYVLLEFGAPWCGHCQAARDAIEDTMKSNAEMAHIKVFDGKGKRLGRQFGVKLWPTLILLQDGQEVKRIVRFTSKDEVRELMASCFVLSKP